MSFSSEYLKQAQGIIDEIDCSAIESMANVLLVTRKSGGRLFVTGSGGGAGHASHAVCDFRKLCGIESYCPTDNVSELTARVNDEGWDVSISNWLRGSRLNSKDCLLVLSVGGGSVESKVSTNLVNAVKLAKEVGAKVLGIVGRDGGYTQQNADACVVVPTVDSSHITPHTESFQAVIWHLLVSHPELQLHKTKWESTKTFLVEKPSIRNGQASSETRITNVKIFADGAEKAGMLEMYNNPMISGFTTNPTLMRKAGISDYREFAQDILATIKDRPISFEVFSDDFKEMESQALEIASWGENVYVKIPITNTKSESSAELLRRLTAANVKVNVTAIMTEEQVAEIVPILAFGPGAYISVFAGRIADTGRDPLPIMKRIVESLKPYPKLELIWASPRELLNIMQADEIGCQIITVTNDILKKLMLLGKDLNTYSLETVKMFYNDARAAGFELPPNRTSEALPTMISAEQV